MNINYSNLNLTEVEKAVHDKAAKRIEERINQQKMRAGEVRIEGLAKL